jgi:ribonuclease HI
MLVTILSDASYCPETRAGGYGYYAVSERGRSHGGGPMKALRANSQDAEMCAAVNAVHFALKYGIAVPGDALVMQMDCTGAMDKLKGAECPDGDSALHQWADLIHSNGLSVSFRHVKAHVTYAEARKSPRLWCNWLCDRHARDGMREARAQVKGGLCVPTTKAIA